ncbi:reverse transcriptase-like protein [Bacillus alveayuensis]|uniref:reverse transcriptase-like protein n=1 Tax=Aeribacillus alveayuensis TaxID=279215 RepID=UPI0005D105BA|nr:reverse transcriptase-like protein [Bacillus alveayuensis]
MLEVYIDGASAGDLGPSGAGIYIKGPNLQETYKIPLGSMNNHEAEFQALVKALEICFEKGYKSVSFRTDSQAVERAVEKRFAKKEPYASLLQSALHYIDQLDLFFIKWIPAKENQKADQLAKEAIRLNGK